MSYVLRTFKKFCNLYDEMIKTHNKEINKMSENH